MGASSQTAVSVVLVGCGAVSKEFYLPTLRVLRSLGELSVHSLVDPSQSARSALLTEFPDALECDELGQVNAPDGSLAIIATPVRFHAEQACMASSRGWHVLCEKPIASNVVECEQMIRAANAAGRLLAVGLYKRFFPSSMYMKSLIDTGALGKIRSFSIAEGGPFKWPAATPSFFDKTQTPGGVLLDIGIHVLDLLNWWVGEPASFGYSDDAMGGLETNSRLILKYLGGVSGTVQLSRDWITANEYRFVFENGIVVWKVNEANCLTVQLGSTPSALQSRLVDPLADDAKRGSQDQATNPQCFIAQLRNVLAAIGGKEALFVPGDQGKGALRLIEQCYQSRTLLPQPWLSSQEEAGAKKLASIS